MQTINMTRFEAIDFARNLLKAAFSEFDDIADTKHQIVYHITSETEES
jgi:hypothetical protein